MDHRKSWRSRSVYADTRADMCAHNVTTLLEWLQCDGKEASPEAVKKCDRNGKTHSVHSVSLGVESGSSLRTALELWQWIKFIMGRWPGNEIF